jgi:hypothetical protein
MNTTSETLSYTLYIGGSARAKLEWKSGRTYTTRSSARRRMRQIRSAMDSGVATLWLVPAKA